MTYLGQSSSSTLLTDTLISLPLNISIKAITPAAGEIIEEGIAVECPAFGVHLGAEAVVFFGDEHDDVLSWNGDIYSICKEYARYAIFQTEREPDGSLG